MTAIGNPRAALSACLDVLNRFPSTASSAAAIVRAEQALRGSPYPAASLETAACLWEAVLDIQSTEMPASVFAAISEHCDKLGTSHLRLTVLGWTDAVDAAWQAAERDEDGFTGGSFDWDFVPGWIVANVDWSNPLAPTIRPPDPLASLSPDLRAYLIDEMGMTIEGGGAAGINLFHQGPNGSAIRVSCEGGGDLPSEANWLCVAYRADDDSDGGMLALSSSHDGPAGVTLRMAVAACCGVIAEYVAPPVEESEAPAAVIVAGLELLDSVIDAQALTDSDADGFFTVADGRTFRFIVSQMREG